MNDDLGNFLKISVRYQNRSPCEACRDNRAYPYFFGLGEGINDFWMPFLERDIR